MIVLIDALHCEQQANGRLPYQEAQFRKTPCDHSYHDECLNPKKISDKAELVFVYRLCSKTFESDYLFAPPKKAHTMRGRPGIGYLPEFAFFDNRVGRCHSASVQNS
jgi:hypothetical protein